MQDLDLVSFAENGLRFSSLPDEEGYVTCSDARIYYASFGQGERVVLLHGGMGNATQWARQVDGLKSMGYRVIVMDTRAHGRSTSGSQTLSYKLFAADLAGLVSALGLGPVRLVGWSDGACTALEYARSNPDKVVGVVFFACNVDPSGTREFKMTPRIQNCLLRHERDYERLTPTLDRLEDVQAKLGPMQQNEPNYSAGDLRDITVPVVVVQGDEDEFISLEHARYLAATLGNGRFKLLPGLSHFAPVQDPNVFNRVLLDALQAWK